MRLLIALFLLVGQSAISSSIAGPPALFQTCSNLKLVDGLGLVVFDAECKSAYLAPSAEGTLKLTAAFVSISDNDCSAVQSAETTALGAFGDAAARGAKRSGILADIKALEADVVRYSSEIDNYKLIVSKLTADAAKVGKEVEDANKAFADQCGGDENRSFSCLAIAGDLKKATQKKSSTDTNLARANLLKSDSEQKQSVARAKITTLSEQAERLNITNVSAAEQADALKAVESLRKEQGAVLSATLVTPLAAELKRLRDANIGSSLDIVQMRFEGGSLYAAGLNRKLAPEMQGQPLLEIPGQELASGGTLFINAAGAKLTLDKVAACQAFAYKRPTSVNLGALTDQVSAAVVAKAYLRYKAALRAKIEVKMNYAKFYELLVKTESKNGFFKTSTVRSVSETLRASNDLVVKVSDEGAMTAEAKDALQAAIRDRVIQRALDFLNPKYVGVDPNATPAVPVAGAPQLANELRKCPNQWCQVGAVVVDLANSVFGGSTSIQNFVQSLNVTSTETYEKSDVFEFVTDLTFTPKK